MLSLSKNKILIKITTVFLTFFGVGLVVLPASHVAALSRPPVSNAALISCTDSKALKDSSATCQCDKDVCCKQTSCLIQRYVNPLIALLSALVGIFVVAGVIIGGIQYSASAGDPQKAAAARARIMKALIALLAFLFLYAFLQFIVPGGKLNG